MSGQKVLGTSEIITVVGDSQLQYAPDAEETQLPCSPSEVPFTNVALETLKKVDEHDKNMQNMVFANQALNSDQIPTLHGFSYIYIYKVYHIYIYI